MSEEADVKDLKFQYLFLVLGLFISTVYFFSDKERKSSGEKDSRLSQREFKKLKRKIARMPSQLNFNQQERIPANIQRPSLRYKKNKKVVRMGRKKKILRLPSARKISGFNYQFLGHYFAVKNTDENRGLYPDAKVKMGHLIVQGEYTDDKIAVVQNKENGFVGIFTNVLVVKLNGAHKALMEGDLSDFQFSYRGEDFSHLNLYYVDLMSKEKTIEAYERLKNKQYLKTISMEVLEYERRAR